MKNLRYRAKPSHARDNTPSGGGGGGGAGSPSHDTARQISGEFLQI